MTYEEFKQKFQINLNKQQLAAVQSVEDPTLLLAVPGSGKTTVLVTRLGYMIYCCGIQPERILTVTYTVAATQDMKARFASIFGNELAERLEFRTINGICAKIIFHYGKCVGKQAYDLVSDEGYKSKLLSAIYQQFVHEYPTESDLKNLSTQITYIKNMMLSKDAIQALGNEQELPLWEIYTAYGSEMKNHSQMDFDDQMLYAFTMLKKMPEVLRYFQEMYPYICVDEAQDTSKIQHEILRLLASKSENLFMVGDEDQSIYGFRAAYPEALLMFEKQHSHAKVLLMEENFRSNAKIVKAADKFIQKNKFRHQKTMRAARAAGADIQNVVMTSRKAQYRYLAKVATQCDIETAVLYRDNESILPVVDLLERGNIPYRMKNADLTFFSHRIVIDIQNVIHFALNPMDTDIFLQIYYKIGTYLNKVAAMEACRISRQQNIPVFEAALGIQGLPVGTVKSVKSMQTHLQHLLEESAEKAVHRIYAFMGYGAYLERMNIKEGKIQILRAIAEQEDSAEDFVQRLQELAELIRDKEYDRDCKFILSTIHSSKGLEYERVFLIDVKDGIFPENVIVNRKKATQEELKVYEEERRLFYVGVTRAKDHLTVFTFKDGATFGRELFGQEIRQQSRQSAQQPKKTYKMPGNSYAKKAKRKIVTESEYLDKMEEIMTTGYIKHKMFGAGRLVSVDGDVVEFEFASKTASLSLKFVMENGLVE